MTHHIVGFMKNHAVVVAFALAAVAFTYYLQWLWPLTYAVGLLASIATGAYLALVVSFAKGEKYKVPTDLYNPEHFRREMLKIMKEEMKSPGIDNRIAITRNLDNAFDQIFDLFLRDYVMSWHSQLCSNMDRFPNSLRREYKNILEKLKEAFLHLDLVEFMTKDVVSMLNKHFESVRLASIKTSGGVSEQPIEDMKLHPWLESDKHELEFVRVISEALLICLLNENYVRVRPVRRFLCELLACNVLKPVIDTLCDPDWLNQSLFAWLDYREKLAADTKRTYSYAATYETFMDKLEKCEDIEHLKQMRLNIISEIVQATVIQHYKRTQGQDVEKEFKPRGTCKGDLLRSRNLGRYLNQLTVCKSYCEKRIYKLGGPDYKSYTNIESQPQETHVRQVLSFDVIMDTTEARNYFFKYLKQHGDEDLLRFWVEIENLRMSPSKERHQRAVAIHETFLAHPGSVLRLHLDRPVLKRIEAFMTGDTGPDALYKAQTVMYKKLEELHYSSFIVSHVYRSYAQSTHFQETFSDAASLQEPSDVDNNDEAAALSASFSSLTESSASLIAEHSTYAQERLRTLQHKIQNKVQALRALELSHKTDYKIVKLRAEMEDEVERFRTEHRQLESHIYRTDTWISNMGHWTAVLDSVHVSDDGKEVLLVMVVHLREATPAVASALEWSLNQGWVVSRRLEQFRSLHRASVQVLPELEKNKPNFQKIKSKLKKSSQENFASVKKSLDLYLKTLLDDEKLAYSEAVYAFLSPSPEHLKHTRHPPPNKPSLAAFFRGATNKEDSSESDEELIFADEYESKDSHGQHDSAASDLYKLVGEVFAIKGIFKWFRKTFIAFVKISTGKSVNRHIRVMVDWMFSEPMLLYYMEQFRDSFWPQDELAPPRPKRTDEQKMQTRLAAKDKLLNNMPDALKQLVGEKNAKEGTIKMFEVFQEQLLNKHLFYNLILAVLLKLFPKIQDTPGQQVPSSCGDSISSQSTNVVQTEEETEL